MNTLILKTMVFACVINNTQTISQPYMEQPVVKEHSVTLCRYASEDGGRYVDVREEMNKYDERYTRWYAKCYNNPKSVAKSILKRVDGTQVIDGVLCDDEGRPLICVGPGVMNKDREYGCSDTIHSDEMKYGTVIDVILEDNGKRYYMECVVADCKAHTYPAGIVQTGYAPMNGEVYYTAPGESDNYYASSAYSVDKAKAYENSVVEFVAARGDLSYLSKYKIEGIIVYDEEETFCDKSSYNSYELSLPAVRFEETRRAAGSGKVF